MRNIMNNMIDIIDITLINKFVKLAIDYCRIRWEKK